jgi:ribosomal protein S27E
MALMQCPHCGAENFTMEGWEDLDHCSSCGKPLGEAEGGAVERQAATLRREVGDRRPVGHNGQNAERPRPA